MSTLAELLDALAGMPSLPGAKCRNRCGQWLESLPKRKRPGGVVAGRVNLANPVGCPATAVES